MQACREVVEKRGHVEKLWRDMGSGSCREELWRNRGLRESENEVEHEGLEWDDGKEQTVTYKSSSKLDPLLSLSGDIYSTPSPQTTRQRGGREGKRA